MKIRTTHDDYIKNQAKKLVNGDYRYLYAANIINKVTKFPGIYCPEMHCVLFHTNGVAFGSPGNIRFRDLLIEKLPILQNQIKNKTLPDGGKPSILADTRDANSKNNSNTINSTNEEDLIDIIIRLSMNEEGFQFMLYDEKNCWYTELVYRDELRKHVGFALRGHQRRCRAQHQHQQQQHQQQQRKRRDNVGGTSDRNTTPRVNKNRRVVSITFMNMDGKTSGSMTNMCGGGGGDDATSSDDSEDKNNITENCLFRF